MNNPNATKQMFSIPQAAPQAKRPWTAEPPYVREFKLPDGRRFTMRNGDVAWYGESKEPGQVIVALKGAKGAMPIMANYDEFKRWVNDFKPAKATERKDRTTNMHRGLD
jgi:hypothetical protein